MIDPVDRQGSLRALLSTSDGAEKLESVFDERDRAVELLRQVIVWRPPYGPLPIALIREIHALIGGPK